MRHTNTGWLAAALLGALVTAGAARGDDPEGLGFEITPPRLSFLEGEVSFWRAGADDWTPAQVNTALAAGDQIYTGRGASLEMQAGPQVYVRADQDTQLALTTLEPDYLQLRLTAGQVSLDLRSLKPGTSYEVATPHAAFTVEHTGYYRVAVDGTATTLTSRRGGRATVTLASGDTRSILASEEVVVGGDPRSPRLESYTAPALDAWDRWNYARTDSLLDAVSARYVSSEVYGVADLDRYGDWRLLPEYGPVWVPRGVAPGWVPYSTGRWVLDPVYRWTWVDDAPWGWAPYHHGRWVYLSGTWGWAPGPLVAHAWYSPALVAFLGGGTVSIGVSFGPPRLGWMALGWGEPVIPWWGPRGYRRAPRWAGWGGPHVVNEVVVRRTTVVNVRAITVYRNARVRDATVLVDRTRFGRGPVTRIRVRPGETLTPLHGHLGVRGDRSSLVAGRGAAPRPPATVLEREVVARRKPRAPDLRAPSGTRRERLPVTAPPVRVAPTPPARRSNPVPQRPPFARRGEVASVPTTPPPRFRSPERARQPVPAARGERARTPVQSVHKAPTRAPAPSKEARRQERAPSAPRPAAAARPGTGASHVRKLPGEPANRVFRRRQGGDEGQRAP